MFANFHMYPIYSLKQLTRKSLQFEWNCIQKAAPNCGKLYPHILKMFFPCSFLPAALDGDGIPNESYVAHLGALGIFNKFRTTSVAFQASRYATWVMVVQCYEASVYLEL